MRIRWGIGAIPLCVLSMYAVNNEQCMESEMVDVNFCKQRPRIVKGIIDLCDINGRVLKLYDVSDALVLSYHYEGGIKLDPLEKKKLLVRYNVNNMVIQDKTKPFVEQPLGLLSFLKIGWRMF